MSIYKRGNTYWYEFVFEGRRVRASTKQGNKNVARNIESAHRTRLAKGEAGIKDKSQIPTVERFSHRFLASVEVETTSKPRTQKFYQTAVRGLLGFDRLAHARLDRVDEALVEEFKQYRAGCVSRRGQPYRASTVNRELAALRRMLGLAHEWKVIDRIPRVRQLRGVTGRTFVLGDEQERLYLGAAGSLYHDFAVLMLDAGLRPGEVLSLEWPQVFVQSEGSRPGYLTIQAAKAKNSKERTVPLTPRLAALLRARKRKQGHVLERAGQPLNARWVQAEHDKLRTLLKLSGEFVPHSLRHTFGTRLGLSGADAFTIMRLMGHSSIVVSQRYVHPTPDALERAIAGMAAMQGQGDWSTHKIPHINSESPVNRVL